MVRYFINIYVVQCVWQWKICHHIFDTFFIKLALNIYPVPVFLLTPKTSRDLWTNIGSAAFTVFLFCFVTNFVAGVLLYNFDVSIVFIVLITTDFTLNLGEKFLLIMFLILMFMIHTFLNNRNIHDYNCVISLLFPFSIDNW